MWSRSADLVNFTQQSEESELSVFLFFFFPAHIIDKKSYFKNCESLLELDGNKSYQTWKALESAGCAQLGVLTWLPADWELAPPTAQTLSAAPAAGPWLSLQNCAVPSPHPDQSVFSWCPNTDFLADCWPAAQHRANGPAPVSLSAGEAAEAPHPGPDSCPAGLAAPRGWVTHQRADARCVAGSHLLGSTDPGGVYTRGIQGQLM